MSDSSTILTGCPHCRRRYRVKSEHVPPQGVRARCPHCGVSLMAPYACDIKGCGSEAGLLLHLPGEGNQVLVCARLNCPGHQLRFVNLPGDLVRSMSQINFFGEGADELFGDF